MTRLTSAQRPLDLIHQRPPKRAARAAHARSQEITMRKFMPTLMCLIVSIAPTALAQSTAPSAVVSASATDSLNAQLTHFSGSNLTFADCQARMVKMETMLGASGYGRRFSRSLTDGSLFAKWYDSVHDTTVVAMAMPSDDGRGYGLDAYAVEGRVHWTDYLPMP